MFITGIPVLAANNGKGNRYQDDPLHGFIISPKVLPEQSIAGYSRWQLFPSHKNFERALLNRGVLISEMQGRVGLDVPRTRVQGSWRVRDREGF